MNSIPKDKQRSYFEIYRDIIDALVVGGKMSYILGKASINSKQKERYFSKMMSSDIIRRIGNNKYEVTEKGKEVSRRIKELISLV